LYFREEEGIELQVLPRRSETPPVANSSRNSFAEPAQAATDADSIDSGVAAASEGKPGGSTIGKSYAVTARQHSYVQKYCRNIHI
jgi:hypothetical protein